MPTVYEKIQTIISKPPSQRTDFEAQEIVPWFRNKSSLFSSVKPGIVKDVIRQCGFLQCKKDDVIIKQGDSGDRLYLVLKGTVSIYVIQDKENNDDVLEQVNTTIEKAQQELDRTQLGQRVWTTGEGNAFGEIALIKTDCIRTASVVIDESADLMVVDRDLYNHSVRDVLEQEFKVKSDFVDKHWLFGSWSARHKKQLTISLRLERYEFGAPLARQGHVANKALFIQRGEVELTIDPSCHKSQFPQLWEDMEAKLPILINRQLLPVSEGSMDFFCLLRGNEPDGNTSPHEMMRRRQKVYNRTQQVSLLGENEYVGCLEFTLRLDHYAYSAKCTCATEVLVLHRDQYDRYFEKRYPECIPSFRKEIGLRVDLYLHRVQNAPLLEYMLLILENSQLLHVFGKRKDAKTRSQEDPSKNAARPSRPNRDETGYGKLMNKLQTRYVEGEENCEPDPETQGSNLERLEQRIRRWLATTNVSSAMDDTASTGQKKGSQGKVSPMRRFQVNTSVDPHSNSSQSK